MRRAIARPRIRTRLKLSSRVIDRTPKIFQPSLTFERSFSIAVVLFRFICLNSLSILFSCMRMRVFRERCDAIIALLPPSGGNNAIKQIR